MSTHSDATHDDAIAVVGLACRLPGAQDIDAFWRNLVDGVDAVGVVPPERWESVGLRDGGVTDRGGFVDGVLAFDAAFFGITDGEAARVCPQQRLLLELAWHAFEHAGIAPSRLAGSDTGVFVGLCGHDFSIREWLRGDSMWLGTGTNNGVAANRISYFLGAHGPSFAVDSACSSSLTAVHLACRSLRDGECSLALAGAANVLLLPEVTSSLAAGGLIAADGRCKSFGAGADGFVRSEGGGMLVLKRHADALRDGDVVHGVILATGVNHNGRSNGLTAPNPAAQAALIRQCVARSGVDAAQIDYVEAAATGTRVGDALEIKSIKDSFVAARGNAAPLAVGSVKSNIGHLEGAGGIAALIKALLCVGRGRIPASLHSAIPNPLCQIDARQIDVPQTTRTWPGEATSRVAAVSSFGFGGSNAHAVVRGAAPPVDVPTRRGIHFLPLSARSPAALAAAYAALFEAQSGSSDFDAAALCASAARHRDAHALRAGVVFADRAGLLAALAAGPDAPLAPRPQFALKLRGALQGCAAEFAALARSDAHFAAIVGEAERALGAALAAAPSPLAPIAYDYCLARWLDGLVPGRKLWIGEGAGEIAAALIVHGAGLDAAASIVDGTFDAVRFPRAGSRLDLHVPPAARVAPYPWRSRLHDAAPDSARHAIVDPATLAGSGDAFAAELLRTLFRHGATIDWSLVHPDGSYRRRELPGYAFQRVRHWPDDDRPADTTRRALRGTRLALPLSSEHRYACTFDAARSAALGDYRIDGHLLLSAAAQSMLVAQAALDAHPAAVSVTLHDATFLAPLPLAAGRETAAQIVLQPSAADRGRALVVADDGAAWQTIATADYVMDAASSPPPAPDAITFEPLADVHAAFGARGYAYGADYRWLDARGRGAHAAQFRLANGGADDAGLPYPPGLLDACLQAIAVDAPGDADAATIDLPQRIARIDVFRPRGAATHYRLDAASPQHLVLGDPDGRPCLVVAGAQFARVDRAAFAGLLRAACAPVDTVAPDGIDAALRQIFVRVLGTVPTDEQATLPLAALGADSLKLMELRGLILRTFQADIDISRLATGATYASLAAWLADRGAHALLPSSPVAPAAAAPDVIRFDAIAEESPIEIEL